MGSSFTLQSNARLIAATNRNLGAMVGDRTFREDLYYRLNVFPIYLPPLRERREDIALLARKFVQQFAHRMNKAVPSISPATVLRLEDYDWPGNIRELQNVLERAVILATGPELEIPIEKLGRRQTESRALSSTGDALDEISRAHILAVLRRTNWVISGPRGAALLLGMKRSTLNFSDEETRDLAKTNASRNNHARQLKGARKNPNPPRPTPSSRDTSYPCRVTRPPRDPTGRN